VFRLIVRELTDGYRVKAGAIPIKTILVRHGGSRSYNCIKFHCSEDVVWGATREHEALKSEGLLAASTAPRRSMRQVLQGNH
jgi:hypothetical protein